MQNLLQKFLTLFHPSQNYTYNTMESSSAVQAYNQIRAKSFDRRTTTARKAKF